MNTVFDNLDNTDVSEILYDELVEYYKEKYGGGGPRHVALAKRAALLGAKKLERASQGAFVHGLQDANKSGWHHLLPEEYETVTEMLRDMLTEAEQEDHESEVYDLSFLVNDLIPVLEAHKVEPALLTAMPLAISKTRAAVPTMRKALEVQKEAQKTVENLSEKKAQVLSDLEFVKSAGEMADPIQVKALEERYQMIDEELQEAEKIAEEKADQTIHTIRKVLEKVADPSVSVTRFKQELAQVAGVQPEQQQKANGYHIILKGGDEAIVFIGNKRQMRAIEMMTRQAADTFISDPLAVINSLQERYVKGATSNRYALVDDELLERDYGRIVLPSPEGFIAKAMNKLFELKEIILQYREMTTENKLHIGIHTLPVPATERLDDHLRLLCSDTKTPMLELKRNLGQALYKLYSECEKKIAEEVSVIFPDIEIALTTGQCYGKFGVFVTLILPKARKSLQ